MFYTQKELSKALLKTGISVGDTLFMHSNIGFFGVLQDAQTSEETFHFFIDTIFDIIGTQGTIIVPTFTYSFGSDKQEKVFDVRNSASKMGIFAESIRKHPDSTRSHDPMFSVAAIGYHQESLTRNLSDESFGDNSFWERFLQVNGKICNLNCDAGSTFIHYVEKCLNVSYRQNIEFTGTVIDENGVSAAAKNIFFCRNLDSPNAAAYFEEFNHIAKREKMAKSSSLGRGSIISIAAQETFDLIKRNIKKSPLFLTKGFLECNPT